MRAHAGMQTSFNAVVMLLIMTLIKSSWLALQHTQNVMRWGGSCQAVSQMPNLAAKKLSASSFLLTAWSAVGLCSTAAFRAL